MEADDSTRPSSQSLPSFVNKILAVFTASAERKPHTFQYCAAAQHKSSAAISEHPRAHTLRPLSLVYLHTSSLINKLEESLAYHLDQSIAADSLWTGKALPTA